MVYTPGVLKTLPNTPNGAGSWLLERIDFDRHNELVTYAPQTFDIPPNTVLGKLTSNGQYVPYNPAGADGSQNFAGIAWDRVRSSASATRGTATVRGVTGNANLLNFLNALTSGQQATLIAAMAASPFNIIARY